MDSLILTAPLDIVHQTDDKGRSVLHYRPRMDDADEVTITRPRRQEVRRDSLNQLLTSLRKRVESILIKALLGQLRSSETVDDLLEELSRSLLPGGSMTAVLPPDLHPVMDLQPEYLLEIPWEGLDDRYQECINPKCLEYRKSILILSGQNPGKFCQQCSIELCTHDNKLGVLRHLCHLAYPGETPLSVVKQFPINEQRRQFVLFVDPTEDLCQPDRDPTGECGLHIRQIEEFLTTVGFDVSIWRGAGATRTRLLNLITDPQIDGLYYFGHAVSDPGSRETALVLHNQERLYASEIESKGISLRFAFINACEAASSSAQWDSEKPYRNFGQAFSSGSNRKIAIAPLWKVANVHAARAAVEFFQHASSGNTLAESLRLVRGSSLARYRNREPDLSWMAYRFFGRPNAGLLDSKATLDRRGKQRVSKLFDASGRLDVDRFEFPIDEILFRAAKRRNLQKRERLTCEDVFAGLVRRGALTRAVIHLDSQKPDELYQAIQRHGQISSQSPLAEQPLPHSFPEDSPHLISQFLGLQERDSERWIVRKDSAFDPDLLRLLQHAEKLAEERSRASTSDTESGLIAERDLLLAYASDDRWALNQNFLVEIPLPKPNRVARQIDILLNSRLVDVNGRIPLDGLDSAAVGVIHAAHRLAARCNCTPIPHRALLIAFLARPNSMAHQRAKAQGVGVELFCTLLLASLSGKEPPPTSVLGLEMAGVVLVKLLKHARAAAGGNDVTEEILLRTFIQIYDQSSKDKFKSLDVPLRIDLDQLLDKKSMSHSAASAPDTLPESSSSEIATTNDSPTWSLPAILTSASEWAAVQRLGRFSLSHLFVAILGDQTAAIQLFPSLDVRHLDLLRRRILMEATCNELVDLISARPNPDDEVQKFLAALCKGTDPRSIHLISFLNALRNTERFPKLLELIDLPPVMEPRAQQ